MSVFIIYVILSLRTKVLELFGIAKNLSLTRARHLISVIDSSQFSLTVTLSRSQIDTDKRTDTQIVIRKEERNHYRDVGVSRVTTRD